MSSYLNPSYIYSRLPSRPSSSVSLQSLASAASSSADEVRRMTPREMLDAVVVRGKAFAQKRIRIGKYNVYLLPSLLLGLPLLFVVLHLIFRHPSSPVQQWVDPWVPVRPINTQYDEPFVYGCQDPEVAAKAHPRANAAFVILARNSELDGVLESMKSLESRFNRWFNYPYVFLNNDHFNETFMEGVKKATSSKVEFGYVDSSMWGFPNTTDIPEAKELIAQQGDRAIMYGGMESYHHMCRFYSGFFFNHPLLLKYKWYWRVEPEIDYWCDITYDPFVYMEKHDKVYGFTIAIKELRETVPNLFRYASAYKRNHNVTSQGMWEFFLESPPEPEQFEEQPELSPEDQLPSKVQHHEPRIDDNAMEGENYNMCHFWSNFEIARLDFFRSEEYMQFFREMDASGGFWAERWGDAPIHSLAVGALLSKTQVHYFRDIGYRHTDIQHCPGNAPGKQLPRPGFSPNHQYKDALPTEWDQERDNAVGCRCNCPTNIPEVEGKDGSCLITDWVPLMGGFTD
ncbi:O-glycoside alpha-1,2-mannosyltransferase 4 [Saitoella coloradoensis]